MGANLIFFSLVSGVITTLLFGLATGLEVSVLLYLAGGHVLFSRELARLRERLDRTTHELPAMVNDKVLNPAFEGPETEPGEQRQAARTGDIPFDAAGADWRRAG